MKPHECSLLRTPYEKLNSQLSFFDRNLACHFEQLPPKRMQVRLHGSSMPRPDHQFVHTHRQQPRDLHHALRRRLPVPLYPRIHHAAAHPHAERSLILRQPPLRQLTAQVISNALFVVSWHRFPRDVCYSIDSYTFRPQRVSVHVATQLLIARWLRHHGNLLGNQGGKRSATTTQRAIDSSNHSILAVSSNPRPARRQGATFMGTVWTRDTLLFQSSPHPKAGRNLLGYP